MKKTIFTILIALISFSGFTQNLLTFQINTTVYSSDGSDIKTGVVVTFFPRNAFVSKDNVIGDVNWWTSKSSMEKGDNTIWACMDPNNRVATRIVSFKMPIQSPKQICYSEISAWLMDYLEGIYGQGNVSVVP